VLGSGEESVSSVEMGLNVKSGLRAGQVQVWGRGKCRFEINARGRVRCRVKVTCRVEVRRCVWLRSGVGVRLGVGLTLYAGSS
jgi:hypothetical protein